MSVVVTALTLHVCDCNRVLLCQLLFCTGESYIMVIQRHVQSEGERVLPDGSVWLEGLFDTLATVACRASTGTQLTFQEWNPNRQNLWLIPVLLIAQVALKIFVIDPLVKQDGEEGDQEGPFSETEKRCALNAEMPRVAHVCAAGSPCHTSLVF